MHLIKHNSRQKLTSYTFRHRGAIYRDSFISKEFKRRPRWNEGNIKILKDIKLKYKIKMCY